MKLQDELMSSVFQRKNIERKKERNVEKKRNTWLRKHCGFILPKTKIKNENK
jgi:uncharacterized protein